MSVRAWRSLRPQPYGDNVALSVQASEELKSRASVLHAPSRSGAFCEWGQFTALSLAPMPCPGPVQEEQAEAAHSGAWPSMGREGSYAVFAVEIAITLLLAADSITSLYCFSWLLKILSGLVSSVSHAGSLSHLLPSLISQGNLTFKEMHRCSPWDLG